MGVDATAVNPSVISDAPAKRLELRASGRVVVLMLHAAIPTDVPLRLCALLPVSLFLFCLFLIFDLSGTAPPMETHHYHYETARGPAYQPGDSH